ncbi:MAG: response regulator [Flavobacteriaceae bacterium]
MNHQNKHILIVEDESILFLGLREVLISHDFFVDEYTPSFELAINRIEKKAPDLVIIDIELQGNLNGFDLGEELSKKHGIPFIYLTDFDSDDNYERGLQTGHEFFFSKKKLTDEKLFIQTIKTMVNKFVDFKGVLGLIEYRSKIREMGMGIIGYVPIDFKNIAFFTTEPFVNNHGELENLVDNYIWFQDYEGETYFLYTSLKSILNELPYYFIRVSGKYIVNILNKRKEILFGVSHVTIMSRDIEIKENRRRDFKDLVSKIYRSDKNH